MTETSVHDQAWKGGDKPFKASYGKLMMWFFLITDTLTFSAFLASYGFSRFKYPEIWPNPEDVFTHFPFLHGDHPLLFVALMTFILIMSSVTMVLAVNYGHKMQKKKVILWLSLTIVGGFMFLGSQAWEWANFISGEYGAIETKGGKILQVVNAEGEQVALESFAVELPSDRTQLTKSEALWYESESSMPDFELAEVVEGFKANPDLLVRTQMLNEAGEKTILSREASLAKLENDAMGVVQGANLVHNEYGPPLFADFFFFITGFHGFHVFTGVLINIIIFINVVLGTYEKRRSYEMVEKVGLYWHFVDLVWVFVFTFFYLV